MNILRSFFHSFFRSNTVVITFDEARQRAKECYKIGDEEGAAKWNSIIESLNHHRGTGERARPNDKKIFRNSLTPQPQPHQPKES